MRPQLLRVSAREYFHMSASLLSAGVVPVPVTTTTPDPDPATAEFATR